MVEVQVAWEVPCNWSSSPYEFHESYYPTLMDWIRHYGPWPWGIRRYVKEDSNQMGFVFIFDDPTVATLFKLTWGGK